MSSELLPCPVCGREPRLSDRATGPFEARPGRERIYFAACHDGGHLAHVHAFGYSPEERAARWNRRAGPTGARTGAHHSPDVGRLVAAARAMLDSDDGTIDPPTCRELEDALTPFERPETG